MPRLTPAQVAAETPRDRDRYVDFLRAFSIVTVVVGHWLIAVVTWRDGHIATTNAVGHQSGLWIATWVLQVMPIFFFVGGFSNAVGWRSTRRNGLGYGAFLRRRLERLLIPAGVFLAVWIPIEVVLHLTDTGSPGVTRGTFIPFGPLWFLGVYAVVVTLSPAMLVLHERAGVGVIVGLVAAVAVIDALRFGTGLAGIGWANLLLVWLAIHQAGFFYADGSLARLGRRAHGLLVAGGLAVLVVLTNLVEITGHLWYPRSMVGVDIEPVSNMSPPSFAIIALAVWQIGAAMLLRSRVTRWLEKDRPWARVVAINTLIMTLFLWHLTAFLIALLALHPLGFGHETTTTARWWLERPVWVGASTVVLIPLLAVFSRWERRPIG